MKLTRTDLCVCRYICCVYVQLLLCYMLIFFFFPVILWVLNLARIFIRVPLISRFFSIKEREIEDPAKISASKIFLPVSSNKVFVQE